MSAIPSEVMRGIFAERALRQHPSSPSTVTIQEVPIVAETDCSSGSATSGFWNSKVGHYWHAVSGLSRQSPVPHWHAAVKTLVMPAPLEEHLPTFLITSDYVAPARYVPPVVTKRESPFDILRRHNKAEAIFALKCLDGIAGARPIRDRLFGLIRATEVETPASPMPSANSVEALAEFLDEAGERVSAPAVSLLPSGSIWLSWSREGSRVGLAIHRDGSASVGVRSTNRFRPINSNHGGPVSEIVAALRRDPGASWVLGGG
jgi:hypothetical protein